MVIYTYICLCNAQDDPKKGEKPHLVPFFLIPSARSKSSGGKIKFDDKIEVYASNMSDMDVSKVNLDSGLASDAIDQNWIEDSLSDDEIELPKEIALVDDEEDIGLVNEQVPRRILPMRSAL